MTPIERMIRVVPSNRASVIKIILHIWWQGSRYKEWWHLELEAGMELNNIMFEVLNEAGETLEVDDKLVSKIKVNWAPKCPKEQLLKRLLPSLKASHFTMEPKYCSISLMEGEGIELQFTIKSVPSVASQLISQLRGENTTLLGEQLHGVY
ncbi:hypothetical protein Btru_077223 [Bulinus truncatus]|nr:hypothetical protein Btru_077223 [Bulinus truncatus]